MNENFTEAYLLIDALYRYTHAFPEAINDFAKWFLGEESDAYNDAKNDDEVLKSQISEDMRAQDGNQVSAVRAWLRGYLTAKGIDCDNKN